MAHYIDINSREFVHILSNMDPRWKPWAEMTAGESKEARAELNSFAEAILALPAADVVEVRHGKWISVESDVIFKCSICEAEISTSWNYDNENMFAFCPCCGADMKQNFI